MPNTITRNVLVSSAPIIAHIAPVLVTEFFGEGTSYRFLFLDDGTFLFGRRAYHCYLLFSYDRFQDTGFAAQAQAATSDMRFEFENAHRVRGAGEVSLAGEVLSWASTGFGVDTPEELRPMLQAAVHDMVSDPAFSANV